MSEKLIDVVKVLSVLWTAFSIDRDTSTANEFPDHSTMVFIIISMFIVFINFINFLKYVNVTQKLVVIIMEIIKDLG